MAVMSATRTRMLVPARGGALVTGFRVADVADAPLTHAGVVEAEALWDAFEYFLKRVVPVAEEAGVRLALHPDDPPIPSLRGVARIMIDVDAFDRAMRVVESDANAICLCQGNFGLMTDDLPGVIRHFGRDGHIAFGHFRDVSGVPTDFVETFHDQGPRDAPAAMRAWHEIGFDGLIRSDHVPTLAGDEGHEPPDLARLHALGYLQGLRDATAGTSEDDR
jgi:mannonate dehydratase